MGRRDTMTQKKVHFLCKLFNLDETMLYDRTKILLSIYRDVCWSAGFRAFDVTEQVKYFCSQDLDAALVYLETFASDTEKESVEESVMSLFETRILVGLIDQAMINVKEFPYNGELYCEIISLCFLGKYRYTESELLGKLGMERSTFYDKKKEAILVFGLSLWNSAIPKMKKNIHLVEKQEKQLPFQPCFGLL